MRTRVLLSLLPLPLFLEAPHHTFSQSSDTGVPGVAESPIGPLLQHAKHLFLIQLAVAINIKHMEYHIQLNTFEE
jgi:hypothetical protein